MLKTTRVVEWFVNKMEAIPNSAFKSFGFDQSERITVCNQDRNEGSANGYSLQ